MVKSYFSDYERYHRHPINKITHVFGIYSIVISLLGLLSLIEISSNLNVALVFLGLVSAWYMYLNLWIGSGFVAFLLMTYLFSLYLPLSALWSLFAVGWIFQFVGHIFFEKKSPAFFKNLVHLFIGPFFIFCDLTGLKKYI